MKTNINSYIWCIGSAKKLIAQLLIFEVSVFKNKTEIWCCFKNETLLPYGAGDPDTELIE